MTSSKISRRDRACLPLLLGFACSIHATWGPPLSRALYTWIRCRHSSPRWCRRRRRRRRAPTSPSAAPGGARRSGGPWTHWWKVRSHFKCNLMQALYFLRHQIRVWFGRPGRRCSVPIDSDSARQELRRVVKGVSKDCIFNEDFRNVFKSAVGAVVLELR